MHLLYLEATSQAEAPNAYLNIARLFASTENVILFPGNLTLAPPSASSLPPPPVNAFTVFTDISTANDQPLTSTKKITLDFSFPPSLIPVLIRQNTTTWCIERGSTLYLSKDPTSRRVLEWHLCLWQLWLDSFGSVQIFPSTEYNAIGLRLSYQAVIMAPHYALFYL